MATAHEEASIYGGLIPVLEPYEVGLLKHSIHVHVEYSSGEWDPSQEPRIISRRQSMENEVHFWNSISHSAYGHQ